MNPRLCFFAAFALLMLSGCAPKPSLVGTWTAATAGPDGKSVPLHLTLKADNTFTMTTGGATPDYSGSYTIQDDTLTETVTGYTVAGKSMTIPAGLRHPQATTFKVSGDTLTLTPRNGQPATKFTRQKG